MNGLRWQPPAFSPLPRAALARAVAAEWLQNDPRTELAALLRRIYDAQVVHLTSTGTAALEVAIRLARVRAGAGAVALPAYGCFDIATAAVGADARIVLYDLDPETLAPDLDSLTGALVAGARIVVVAPVAGVPVDWDAITNCAAGFGAVLVEDAAQGHGSRWRHRPLGALGPIGVLSFGRGKGWTGGRGGAVIVRDPVLAEFSRGFVPQVAGLSDELRVLALALAQGTFAHPALFALPAHVPWLRLGETRYQEPRPREGLTRAAAAMLMATNIAANYEAARRRANADSLLDMLAERSPHVTRFAVPPEATPGYLRLPVRIAASRGGRARAADARRYGAAEGYPSTLAALPAVRNRLHGAGRWPGAATLVRELITLPTHGLTLPSDRRAIIDAINSTAAVAVYPSATRQPQATPAT